MHVHGQSSEGFGHGVYAVTVAGSTSRLSDLWSGRIGLGTIWSLQTIRAPGIIHLDKGLPDMLGGRLHLWI